MTRLNPAATMAKRMMPLVPPISAPKPMSSADRPEMSSQVRKRVVIWF